MEPEPPSTERLCDACEVRTTEPDCWVCGQPTRSVPRLHITSQHGYGPAMSTDQWQRVRQRVLTE